MNNLLSTVFLTLCAMAAVPSAMAAPFPMPLALKVETAQLGMRATASIAETCEHFILFANTLTATCRLPGSSGSRGKKPSTPPSPIQAPKYPSSRSTRVSATSMGTSMSDAGPSCLLVCSGTGFSSNCTELTLDLEDMVLLKRTVHLSVGSIYSASST
ncbi:hypothetical protein B0H13DRAFT_1923421 [Mycena leptocephala]|nr:hypothetical protein B0H13DRAFT_1923421 [Mycena leptocephala]